MNARETSLTTVPSQVARIVERLENAIHRGGTARHKVEAIRAGLAMLLTGRKHSGGDKEGESADHETLQKSGRSR
jgi:hypothetical protein